MSDRTNDGNGTPGAHGTAGEFGTSRSTGATGGTGAGVAHPDSNGSARTSPQALVHGLVYCGAHYRLCPVEVREVWAKALGDEQSLRAFRSRLEHLAGKPMELVVISTCNRFDICVSGHFTDGELTHAFARVAEGHLRAEGAWSRAWEPLLSPEKLATSLRFARDADAVRLLFRVGASLDSLVIGEPHILGQLKEAFAAARRQGLAGGDLTPLFARAFHVAKRVRNETDLGRNGVSIGHAAVEIARRVYERFQSHAVLVVGAGEMARIVAQHFLACGARNVTIANRTRDKAASLVEELARPDATVAVRELDGALAAVGEYDIVVVATSSPRFLVERKSLERALRKRSGTPIVLVDISVPRNVDPACANLDSAFVFDVDDLDKIMEGNRHARRQAAARAEAIVGAEVEVFARERRQRESLRAVGRFHATVRETVIAELSRRGKAGPGMPAAQAAILADAIAKKLVSLGATRARDERPPPPLSTVGDALEFLFNLDTPARGDGPEPDARAGDATGGGSPTARVIPMRKETKA